MTEQFKQDEMTVLEGKTRMGDFVHSGQEMASDQDFGKVSKIWYDKTISLSDGIDAINDEKRSREDIMLKMSEVELIVKDNTVAVRVPDGREFVPTPHAALQMASKMYTSHSIVNAYRQDVMRQNGKLLFKRDQQDAETLLTVYRNGQRRVKQDDEFRLRTYTDGTLRAFVTDTYAPINNVWYLETLAELFREIGGTEPRLSHWRGDADTIYGNLLIPDSCRAESDSDYGGMVSLSNCEIGIRAFDQYPSIFRAICMNGCIWDRESGAKMRRVHRGEVDLGELREKLANNIHKQIPLIADAVDRFLACKDRKFENSLLLKNVIAQAVYDFKMPVSTGVIIADEWANNESENRNLFGLINAITRAGQRRDNAEWVDFDFAAGDLMNFTDKKFESFVGRAANLEQDKLEKVFEVAL